VYDPTSDSYTVNYYMATVPHMVTVPATQIIHLRNTITAIDGFTGMPLLQYAARTLNLSATQDQFTLDTFSKGGRYKMLLQEQQQGAIGVGGKVNRDQMEKAREKLQKDLPNNDVVFVPNVASVTNMSQTLGEMELSTMRKLSVADISRLTGVPRNLLGDDSNSSYKTPEAATLDFLSNGIAPQIEELEDEFNRKLLGEAGWGEHKFVFDVTPLFRLDRDAQGAWNKNRLETGVSSINELRAEQNLSPIINGNDHYVSTNLAVAGSPKLTGEIEKGVEP
jgi:HK97 family phage portal protein